jgi:hypothetical protein
LTNAPPTFSTCDTLLCGLLFGHHLAFTFGLVKTAAVLSEIREIKPHKDSYTGESMDSRHRNWNDLFGAHSAREPLVSVEVSSYITPPHANRAHRAAPIKPVSIEHLEELWAQSLALRQHALHVRAVAMEVRAMARDLRQRNQAA